MNGIFSWFNNQLLQMDWLSSLAAAFGLMSNSGLVIDGRLVSSGKMLTTHEIGRLL